MTNHGESRVWMSLDFLMVSTHWRALVKEVRYKILAAPLSDVLDCGKLLPNYPATASSTFLVSFST